MKCIEDEIPFEVPAGWEWCRMQTLTCKIGAGSTPTGGNSVYSRTGIKFIRSQNVYEDGLVLDDIAYISKEINNKKSGSIVKAKDILLNITGGSIGRSTLVPDDFDIGNVNQHVLIVRLVDLELRKFTHLTLTSPHIQKQIIERQVGSGRGGLSATTFSSFLMPIPPLSEQERIQKRVNEYLNLLFSVNNDKNSLKCIIEFTKNKVLNLAIQGKLVSQNPDDEPASVLLKRIRTEKDELIKSGKIKRDKKESVIFRGDDNSYYEKFADGNIDCIDEEIHFKLPNGWECSRIKSIVKKDIKRGKAPKYTENSNTMVFAQKCNRKKGEIDMTLAQYLDENALSKYPAEEFMQDGDILINSTGTGTLGRVGIYHSSENIERKNIVPDSHVTTIRSYEEIQAAYVYIFLKSIQPYLENHGEGSTNQKELKPDTLKSLIIPIPPCSEQQKIISIVKKAIDSLEEIETVLM